MTSSVFASVRKDGFQFSFDYDPVIVDKMRLCLDAVWSKPERRWFSQGRDVLLDMRRFGIEAVPVDTVTKDVIASSWRSVESIVDLHHRQAKGAEDYQAIGTQMLLQQGRGLLGDVMGLGKTKQSLDAIHELGHKRILVLAIKSLLWNWSDEVQKWYPGWRPFIVPDKQGVRLAAYNKIADDDLDPDNPVVVIANYDKVLSPQWPVRQWDAVIFDEAQSLRNRKALRTKEAKILSRSAQNVWSLSGTPVVNSVGDLFGIFDVTRPGLLGGWTRFSNQHLELDNWGNPRASRNTQLLQERVAPWMLRRTHKDVVGQLPDEPRRTTISVDLNEKERAAYERTKRRVLDSATGAWVSHTALAPLQRFLVAPESVGHPEVHSSKLEALKDLLAGWEGKALLFVHHIDVAHSLQRQLKSHPAALIIGEVAAEERLSRVNAFNDDQLGKVFICNDSGAYGLNFTSVGMAVHVEPDWLPSVEEQREGRIWRRGQRNAVLHIVSIVARATVDYRIRERNDSYRQRRHELMEEPAKMLSGAELRTLLA